MKVLYIASWYGTRDNPIKGSFFKEQFEALNYKGVDGVVLALDFRSIRRIRKWGLIKKIENNVVVYTLSLPFGPTNIAFDYLVLSAIVPFIYNKICRFNGEPEIIHAHALEDAGIFGLLIKQKYNKKLVVTEHSSGLYAIKKNNLKYKIYKKVYDKSDTIISVSHNFSNIIKDLLDDKNKIKVIPNITDFEKFRISGSFKNQAFTFISIGNVFDVKGFDVVINSFYMHDKNYKNSKLLIVGEGSKKQAMEKLAKDLGVENKVEFLGLVSREEIPNIINSAHCLVMGSRKETFGVVFIEALACGIPIIATKCDGPKEIVKENNGILVNIDDVNDMCNAMNYISNNYMKYNPQEIRIDAESKYSSKTVANAIIDEYDMLLKL